MMGQGHGAVFADGLADDRLAEAKAVADRAQARRRLRHADWAAGALLSLLCAGVVANALLFQGAPIGAPPPPARPARVQDAPADKIKPPPPRAAAHAPAPGNVQTGGATEGSLGYLSVKTTVAGAPLPAASPASSAAAARADGLRRPLAAVGSDVTGAVRPPAEVPSSARVLGVQRALSRLGYGPLKVDGRPGGETRLAIQRFQRDRNLPADGAMSDRLVRELAAVSGAAVE